MDKKTVYIIIGFIVALLFFTGAGFLSGYLYQKRGNSQSIIEYQNTVDQLGVKLEEQRKTNTDLRDINTDLRSGVEELSDSLNRAQNQVTKTRAIIDSIGSELSGSLGDVSDIIRAIDKVIKSVEEFETME